ncbi:MAG: D-aminoacylase [Clostridia bacterium]|nr:D-aminoacylase [Clostridia bacterium]
MKIIIKNGKVIDGSGAPWYRADMLINNGVIEAVGKLPETGADTVIDAKDLAVAPGFIDAHSHSDMTCIFYPDADGKIVQGVTTEVAGMCGETPVPLMRYRDAFNKIAYRDDSAALKLAENWNTFAQWAECISDRGLSTDLALAAGHGTIRANVMGFDNREPTAKEIEEMKALLRDAMSQGAIGLSSGLIYPPGCYGSTAEIIELCKVMTAFGGIYVTHMRNEADELIPALEEAISIGRVSGCKVQISHHKAAGMKNHGKVTLTMEMMEAARAEGIDISCDAYPYVAGSSSIITLLPKWAHDGGKSELLRRLQDRDQRRRISNELLMDIPGWENMYKNAGMEGILICDVPKNKQYEGKNLKEIGEDLGKDPIQALIDLIIDEEGEGSMACFAAKEEDNCYIYKHRLTMVGSDSASLPTVPDGRIGKPHPRSYGTFPRVLGHYARERKLFPLETAVWKMTGFPATRYGLKDRGFLSAGKRADVVIFDPKRIADSATYQKPSSAPEGIHYVIQKGEVVVQGIKYHNNRLGRIIT